MKPPHAGPSMPGPLPWLRCYLTLLAGYLVLVTGCLLWSGATLPASHLWRGRTGVRVGRRVATRGFRLYVGWLSFIRFARFDLHELDTLRNAGPLIIAPNHPGLLDAVMLISRLDNVVCMLKASLLDNILWGAGARFAGYVRNDWFIGSITRAIAELRQGSQLLLFPEGTRTNAPPQLNAFRNGLAYIAHRAGVPVQTVFIEQDNRFLGKGWPFFRRLDPPLHFRIRLGQRFDPPADPETFTRELQAYFASELREYGACTQ